MDIFCSLKSSWSSVTTIEELLHAQPVIIVCLKSAKLARSLINNKKTAFWGFFTYLLTMTANSVVLCTPIAYTPLNALRKIKTGMQHCVKGYQVALNVWLEQENESLILFKSITLALVRSGRATLGQNASNFSLEFAAAAAYTGNSELAKKLNFLSFRSD
uniref:Uncharacterized protein n=1 Tax=Glossina austeni TaxID=7395 RepID=A0A1A9V9B4_GLOAU